MGNKLSLKSSQLTAETQKQVKHTDKGSESSKESTLKNTKQPFSCGVFKRKTSSIFLDYEGLSFDEYFRKKQSGSKGSTTNSVETTSASNQGSLVSSSSRGGRTVYSKSELEQVTGNSGSFSQGKSVSDNQIYSQISDQIVTSDSQIYSKIGQHNIETNNPSYESIMDMNHRENEIGRPLKYSMERQLSNHTEEVDDITSLYCLENDSEKDEFEHYDLRDMRDSDQFYRPWSLTQSPQSVKNENFEPHNIRSDSSLSWKGAESRKSSNNSKKSDHDPGMLPRRRSESRRSVKSIRSMSRKVSISYLKPHDLETSSLHNSILTSYGPAKEDNLQSRPHHSANYSHTNAQYLAAGAQNDQKCPQVLHPANLERNPAHISPDAYLIQSESDLDIKLDGMRIDHQYDTFDNTDSYFENQSQDFPSFSVDIDRLRNQVSDMTDNERSDSELNLEFEKFKKGKEKNADPHQDEGFNGSNLTQTEYATEDDIPDLELEEDSRYTTRSSSSTQSPVSQTVHILGSVQTREIRGTWVVILAQLQKVGVQCIVDLFELHPFVREHFKEILVQYGKLDPDNDNALQNILENHAKLVMNIVHELVVNIDNLDSLGPRLQKLGLFHVKNAVPKRYLDIMGPIFCNAVRPILLKNDVWSSEVEESWMEFFKVLTTVMGKSYVENVPTQLSLSPTQKCVIVATWHSIFLKHMNFMGKQLFVDLFKVEPNILKYFDAFRDVGLSNLLQSRSFQNHGVRIMNLVKFAVENLDNPEKLQDHMLVLGRLHVKKGIDSKFLDLMGPTFCQAIRPMVMAEGQWSIDIEGAWIHLFKILVQMMKCAYEEKESTTVFPSPKQIGLMLESWSDIEAGLDEIGVESFKKLFESHSDIQTYFPSMKKISSSDLDMTRKIKEHSGRVMGLVRLYVENIHDIEKITPNIESLGKSHYQRGIKSEYIDVMGPIFCNTIRPLLVRKDLWSLQLEEVWLSLFKKISDTMKKGYPREKRKSSKFLKQYKAH